MTSPELPTYPLHQRTLDNGLQVIVSPDHTVPVVAVNLWYAVGSRDEDPGRTGFAHLFEHVMFQGSEHVVSGEHFNALQSVGGSLNATTFFDRTNYFETVPTGALDLALWLEADRMGHLLPALTQANLDTQRDVVKEEKRQRYDNAPYGDLLERLVQQAFPADHPYGHTVIGSMTDLDAASLADAHAFFTAWYSPSNAVLTLVGDVEPEEGFAKAETFFGPLPARNVPGRTPPAPLPPHTGIPRARITADVPASALYLGWRIPARGTRAFDAAEIALTVLGASHTARLWRRLVHTDEQASLAGASTIGLVWGTSLAFAYARAREGVDLQRIEEGLTQEVQRLVDEGPTDVELARARVQFEREWLSECAQVGSRADLFSGHASLFGDPGLVNRRIADYQSITAAEVQQAASAWLQPDQRAVLEYHRRAQEDRP